MARKSGTGATGRGPRGGAGRQVSAPRDKAAGAVQSLTRGLQLLQRLGEAEGGVMLTDLAQTVGLPNSTAHRLLTTLEAMGFARQTPDLGLWQVGVEAFRAGNAFLRSRDIVEQARPHLYRLMEEAGETTNLALLNDGRAVMVYQVEMEEKEVCDCLGSVQGQIDKTQAELFGGGIDFFHNQTNIGGSAFSKNSRLFFKPLLYSFPMP